MSEDVKPRIWKAISIEWRKDSLVRVVTTFKEEGLSVIELEPTMRLMDELVKTLQIYAKPSNYERHGMVHDDQEYYAEKALEKYKKFKEELK